MQIDTTNILFIVGGAFAGLEEIINRRIGRRPLGFNNDADLRRVETDDPFAEVRPEDLHAYGLIPEFIGRLPMISTVTEPDKDALVRILVERTRSSSSSRSCSNSTESSSSSPKRRSRRSPSWLWNAESVRVGCVRSSRRSC